MGDSLGAREKMPVGKAFFFSKERDEEIQCLIKMIFEVISGIVSLKIYVSFYSLNIL